MKILFLERAQPSAPDGGDTVELLTLRYHAACTEYQDVVDKNEELCLNGGRPSEQALYEEERAFEALDCARHALVGAAEAADPTIH